MPIVLPCILKQPDSAFSLGVTKIESERALQECLRNVFERSDLADARSKIHKGQVALLDEMNSKLVD